VPATRPLVTGRLCQFPPNWIVAKILRYELPDAPRFAKRSKTKVSTSEHLCSVTANKKHQFEYRWAFSSEVAKRTHKLE
jgi:hypothetical protein